MIKSSLSTVHSKHESWIKGGGQNDGSLGSTPTRNCNHFLKIGFVVSGGVFYSYYIRQGNKSDTERKIVRKI